MYPSSSKITQAIHTLRGEYFRHTQNQQHLPPNLKARTSLTHNSPTLPADLLADSAYSKEKPRPPRDTREALFVSRRADPPQHDFTTSVQRAEVLSVVLPTVAEQHCPQVPPLTLLCLQILITTLSDADFSDTVLPFIPSHLRHDLLRWTAIHRPLNNNGQIRALCGPEGHLAGELILIGPNANVREDQFRDPEHTRSAEWESDDWLPPPPMHTFVLVSAHLSFSTLCSLPATLTRLALVNLPTPVSLHRLPTTCPLVECLDLSYNTWLVAEKEAQERLGKVKWSRWHQLRTLGIRGCHVPADMIAEVNKGRWDDVRVVK